MRSQEFCSTGTPQTIGVVGLGYVGAVTAACLAKLGHKVYGFETNLAKLAVLRDGNAPFYEPGLSELLSCEVRSGRLKIHPHPEPAMLAEIDTALVCVGTPTGESGAHDYTHLNHACASFASALRAQQRGKPITICIRSTTTPGTTEHLRDRLYADMPDIQVAYNPEFLREGSAIKDFFHPALLAVGADDKPTAMKVLSIYDSIDAPKLILSLRTAELVKGVCNAFHALKASFANEIGSLAAACSVDPEELMSVVCADTALNISSAYLKPGFAFGGSCLPKDVRALDRLGRTEGLELPLIGSILPSNEAHLRRAASRVVHTNCKRIGLIGVSFKTGTDDVRESPALQLVSLLQGSKVEVRAFDEDILAGLLHGSNLTWLEGIFPEGMGALVASIDELLHWAEVVVITKRLSPEAMASIRESNVPIVDLSKVAHPLETGGPVMASGH
jgi:GDP-mannose 6-dehydrogenase